MREPHPSPSSSPHAKRRGEGSGPSRDTVLTCRVRVVLPPTMWMRTFSVRHPTIRVEILDRLEVDTGLVLFEVQIPTADGESWAPELEKLPEVRSVELIDATEGSEVYRILYSGRTFLPLVKRLKLLRHFPFPIQDGLATWTIVGPESKVHELLRTLERERIEFDLGSIHRGPLPQFPATLTPRQRVVLRRAIDEGYFDVPRRVSLTELAPRIGVAISTLSVTLAVIERKIVESASWRGDMPDPRAGS